MLKRPQVFRPLAVERYTTRRDSATLPRLQPPQLPLPAVVLLVTAMTACIGVTLISIPLHTPSAVVAARASVIVIAAVQSVPYAVGQPVFVRRRSDGIVIARGAVIRVLGSARAEARLDGNLSSLSPGTTVVVVETGRETLLHSIARKVFPRTATSPIPTKANSIWRKT